MNWQLFALKNGTKIWKNKEKTMTLLHTSSSNVSGLGYLLNKNRKMTTDDSVLFFNKNKRFE